MVDRAQTAYIKLWGEIVGAVSWRDAGYAEFEYDASFLQKRLNLSPVAMPVDEAVRGDAIYAFPGLSKETFMGLPGLLADALPDKFGNKIIDAWLARNGRDVKSFTPVERLCYMGRRGMGALEFSPALSSGKEESVPVEIARLVELAQAITTEREGFSAKLGDDECENTDALLDILRVGTSAGGARAKAVIAMNSKGDIRSGQTKAPKGYSYWLLKFDGVDDLELGATQGYGRIEYAYALMARAAGINISECKLLEEGGRAHFMTKRFDRVNGEKLHMQSLCGIAHYDFNLAGAYGYEQVFAVMRKLRLPKAEAAQQFRRMVFNVVSRNQDDHTKNIAFLMDKSGQWRLSPAFDVTYAHNPQGRWTHNHQMTINGKQGDFTLSDFERVGQSIGLNNSLEIVAEIVQVVSQWPKYAKETDVGAVETEKVGATHRLSFDK
ncbi:MAG: type II toxin-antitoxin system HipA family toxin [Desulfuromonadales bacterium]|nr:type II toxin-antitoxin system HipA family toxin [Desulfuromonadales bacterium]